MRAVFASSVLFAATALAASSAAGIQWTAPEGWKAQPDRQMRVATYAIPAAKGDAEGGELAVFYFGQGQGGSVDANVDRWIAQFEQPDGKPSKERAQIRKDKAGKLPLTTIELPGTYLVSVGGMMSPQKEKKPGYRLLGAIVDAPEGAVFFKLTGPEKTVTAAQPAFTRMVKAVKVTGGR